jgi:hypothetical protein
LRHVFDVRSVGRRSFDAVLFLAAAALLPALVLRVQSPPADPSAGVALIYPPWTAAAEAAAKATAAGATLMRFGVADFIVVVRADDPTAVGRMLRDGAWLAIDPRASGLCAPGSESS